MLQQPTISDITKPSWLKMYGDQNCTTRIKHLALCKGKTLWIMLHEFSSTQQYHNILLCFPQCVDDLGFSVSNTAQSEDMSTLIRKRYIFLYILVYTGIVVPAIYFHNVVKNIHTTFTIFIIHSWKDDKISPVAKHESNCILEQTWKNNFKCNLNVPVSGEIFF